MKAFNYFKSLAVTALILALGGGLAGCIENDDQQLGDLPVMTLSATTLNFTQEPDDAQSFRVDITGAGSWTVEAPEAADQVTINPDNGTQSADVYVLPTATLTQRQIKLEVTLYGDIVGRHVQIEKQYVTINQSAGGGAISTERLYFDNFDGEPSATASPFPYIDEFPGFANPTGPAAKNVTYSGKAISVRNNSFSNNNYSDIAAEASGVNNLFFGNNASFVIEGLELEAGQKNLRLQLAAVNSVYVGNSVDNSILFQKDKFHILLSNDGTKWVELKDYTHSSTEGARWGYIEKNFSLKAVPEKLYIKFASDENNFRIDDVALYEGVGGVEADLDNGTADGDGGNDQPGDVPEANTPDNPMTVAEAIAVAKATGTTATEVSYYIKGKVSNVKEQFSAQYGNATLELVDEGANDVFTAYRILYFGNKKWTEGGKTVSVGDDVVVYGQIVNYMGNTPETVQGSAYLYSLNGESEGGDEPGVEEPGDDSNLKGFESQSAFTATTDDSGSSSYTLGSSTVNGESATGFKLGTSSKAGTFTSAAVGVTGDKYLSFYGFAWKNTTASIHIKINGGGTIDGKTETSVELKGNDGVTGNPPFTITATDADFHSFKVAGLTASSTVTLSTAESTGYRVVMTRVRLTDTEETGKGDQPEEPEVPEVKAVSVSEFLAAEVSTKQVYELTGTVDNIVNTTYGNFDLVDESGKVYVYGLTKEYVASNDKSFSTLGVEKGDKIKIHGYRAAYNGDAQVGSAWLIEIVEKGKPEEPEKPAVGLTPENPLTVAQALEKARETGETATAEDYYIKGFVASVTEQFSANFGNATFTMSDSKDAAAGEFTAYRVYYLNNQKWVAGNDTVNKGDEVIVCGKIVNYKGNTPETVQNTGYIYQFVSKAEPEQPEQPEQPTGKVVNGNTIVFNTLGYGNAELLTSIQCTDYTLTFDKGTGSTDPAYYNSGTSARVYGGNTFTFDAGNKKIAGIKFTFDSGEKDNEITADKGSFATDTWSGSESKVTFTIGGTSGHRRLATIEVTMEGQGGSEPETPAGKVYTDVLNQAWTGITGTTYTDLAPTKGSASNAVYAGQCAGDKSSIQLRSSNNNSGIVTTVSGGKVTKISVKWVADTADARVLKVYGKNEAYTAATELYSADTQGTEIASFTKGDGDKELVIEGDYKFIGFRSNSGALYLNEVQISWEE